MVKKKVLEHLVDYLVDNHFDTFFLVTGGAIVPTVDYIGRKEGATYYCFQHEQSAAMAAESFYRTSGKMVVGMNQSHVFLLQVKLVYMNHLILFKLTLDK